MLYAGLRAKELLNLRLLDVNQEGKIISIRSGKGNKDRNVPIHIKLKHILKRYLDDRKRAKKASAFLFMPVQSSKQLGYKALNLVCKKLSKATMVKFTPHCLRHTFASVAIEQGMGLVPLKEIMGHSDIASTMIYLKMSPEVLKKSMGMVDLF